MKRRGDKEKIGARRLWDEEAGEGSKVVREAQR